MEEMFGLSNQESMMTKVRILILAIFLGAVILPVFVVARAHSQQDEQKNLEVLFKSLDAWLNSPIQHIITKEEEKAYKLKTKLKKREEQLHYIEFFWRRRDPTPDTPRNEFRDEFVRRVAHSNTYYKIGDRAGWDSQRGQVFIVLGPPSEIDKGPRTETWLYYNLPGEKIPDNFSILFYDQRGNNDYRVSRTTYPGKDAGEVYMESQSQRVYSRVLPREIIQGIEEINALAIANSSLTLAQVPPPPKSLLKPTQPEPQSTQPEMTPTDEVPFEIQQVFFQGEESKVEMMVGFSLPYRSISFKDKDGIKTAELEVTAELKDSSKNKVDDFSETFILTQDPLGYETETYDTFKFWKSLQAEPGQYSLEILSEDKTSRERRELRGDIIIPQLKSKDPVLTTIIPAYSVTLSSESIQERSHRILHIQGFDIAPNFQSLFSKQENFCIFFQLLNLKRASPDFEINCYVFQDEKIFKPLKLQRENLVTGRSGEIIAHLCLPLNDFPTGEYDVIIQAKDNDAGKEAVKKLKIAVKE